MADRRKQVLVQNFQYKLAVRIVAYWFLYSLALWNVLACWHLLQHGQGHFFQEYRQFMLDFYPMLFCFLVLAPLFAWDAVRFYHTIAGPLVQFRRQVRNIANEEPVRPIKLRNKDQLVELRDEFNRMIDTLTRKNAATLDDGQGESGDGHGSDDDRDIELLTVSQAPSQSRSESA
jgi:methyl-accepting chemotaxis protein